MDTSKDFEILVRRKVPYISEGLSSIVVVFFLIIILFYFIMLPTKFASTEMSTAYYILAIPQWFKRIPLIAVVGLIIFMPIYYVARLKKNALLKLGDDALFIEGKHLDLTIPFENIKKIYFSDLSNLFGKPKGKMQIVIQQKMGKVTTFLLANYDEGGLAIANLGKITNVQFAFSEDNMVTSHDDDT